MDTKLESAPNDLKLTDAPVSRTRAADAAHESAGIAEAETEQERSVQRFVRRRLARTRAAINLAKDSGRSAESAVRELISAMTHRVVAPSVRS